MRLNSKEKLKKLLGLSNDCQLVGFDGDINYRYYIYECNGKRFTIICDRITKEHYIKLDDEFAIAMGYNNHLHMMSKDHVIGLFESIRKIYGRWVFKRVLIRR